MHNTNNNAKAVLLAAGGTGGHLFPAIALAEKLTAEGFKIHLAIDPRVQSYLADDNIFPYTVLKPSNGIIPNKIARIISPSLLIQAWQIFKTFKPNIVIGFGGYPTLVPLLISALLRIPIILYEPNAVLGLTNRIFSLIAKKIACAYEQVRFLNNPKKQLLIGHLVRQKILDLPAKQYDINNRDNFTILVFGGSQGAKIFSSLVTDALVQVQNAMPNLQLKVIQQAILADHDYVIAQYKNVGIEHKVAEFFHNMPQHYLEAHLAITRAGASTIAELSSIGLPSIFIPYPHAADNHQFFNAKALANLGCGWYFVQQDINSQILAQKILELINNPQLLKQASQKLIKPQHNSLGLLLSFIINKAVE